MSFDARGFFNRWLEVVNRLDFDAMESMMDPDCIVDYPQSGERFNGWEAFKTHLERYPGGLDSEGSEIGSADIVNETERWAITPAYTVVPLAQAGTYTTLARSQYPDGSWWRIVTLVEMRNDRIFRAESFFAPELPAPLGASLPRLGAT